MRSAVLTAERVSWRRCAALAIALLVAGPGAQAAGCSHDHARAAMSALGGMSSWPGAAAWYARFAPCLDAGIAEGASAHVMTLLADHWDQLPALAAEVARQPALQRQVVLGVSAIGPEAQLRRIARQARQACPPRQHGLCQAIGDKAEAALKAQRNP